MVTDVSTIINLSGSVLQRKHQSLYQQWYFFLSPSLCHPNNQIPSRYLTFPNTDHTCFFFCRSLSLNINTSLSWGTENGFFLGFTTDSMTVNKWKNINYFYRSSGHLFPNQRAFKKMMDLRRFCQKYSRYLWMKVNLLISMTFFTLSGRW